MSWQKRVRLRDDVGLAKTTSAVGGAGRALPLVRTAESEVKSVLKGLARRHRTSVAEVARNLESGMWSRDHHLGAMRLQLTFEKMCDERRFADASAREPRELAAGRKDPRAA